MSEDKKMLEAFIVHLNKILEAVNEDNINADTLSKVISTIKEYYKKFNKKEESSEEDSSSGEEEDEDSEKKDKLFEKFTKKAELNIELKKFISNAHLF
jgi:site-specific recombinase XerD